MKRVLVADDNKLNRELLKAISEQQGHQVIEACDGKEVLRILQKQTVDLIFMDCHMPNMNGFEATRKISRMFTVEDRKKFQIIGISAYGNQLETECLEAGMDRFFPKPISLNVIRGCLRSLEFVENPPMMIE